MMPMPSAAVCPGVIRVLLPQASCALNSIAWPAWCMWEHVMAAWTLRRHFDLACLLIEWGQPDPAVRELAEVSMEGGDRNRAADLALRVLAAPYGAGLDGGPGRLAVVGLWLASGRAALARTGPYGLVRRGLCVRA